MTAYGLTAPILYHLTRHYLFWHSWLRYLAQNWGWVQQSRTEWFPSPRMVVRVMWHSSAWLTAPQSCRAERGKAHLWLKAGSYPGGAQARGHCPVPVASSTPVCWALHQQDPGAGRHSPGPKPGHMWVWWGQRGAPLQGKTSAQHRPELCSLLEQCVIWGCFRHLGGFWTVELCYLLPGLFDFHSPHGEQSADTMMEIEVVDSAASVWRGKVSSAQTSQCCPISHPPDLWIFPSFK